MRVNSQQALPYGLDIKCIPADLWLSLNYRPPVTVSDTACTFSAHLSMIFVFVHVDSIISMRVNSLNYVYIDIDVV